MRGDTACLAHLADAEREAYLAGLQPGADVDHRGTSFTAQLLDELLDALRAPGTRQPHLGDARFSSATFEGAAGFSSATFEGAVWFESATFKGTAWFSSATFKGTAWFSSATFEGAVRFESATFKGTAWFKSATFKGTAWFAPATFEGAAWFESATFEGAAWFRSAAFKDDAGFESATFKRRAGFESTTFEGAAGFESTTFEGAVWFKLATFEGSAWFNSATFEGIAWFESAIFEGTARFKSATFEGAAGFESATFKGAARFNSATFNSPVDLGPFVCSGMVTLVGAVFGGPMTLSCVARRVECRRTRWMSTAELRMRYATVDFSHAVFEYPLTFAGEAVPFLLADSRALDEQAIAARPDATVRIVSLRGVDAAHLVLADIDLTRCVFTGAVHLDQLRLEGTCTFAQAPAPRPWRWGRFTQRRTLAEEQHWRARQPGADPGWDVAEVGVGSVTPAQLAPVYRALRKGFEDGKNEPGAADFYYGEMEMRRRDHTGTTRAERGLLHGYWLLSGYGLRAVRALGWLAVAMAATIVLLMGLGLPKDDPPQEATGKVPAGGGTVTFEIEKDDPQNPTGDRFTGERFDKALNVTLNSVVFRSSGQDLTTTGTYIEMASRVTEPVLLGLALLAVRNRVKR
ncbi:pentapeptide repeat-containing protein [Streptomyces sp. NPDC056982]|uniref:pentapeptide repeat-containing protein n=1 Tax=Streptomyces sp. NPDC056982 TaxID=3345986 RepID=UPI0036354540